MSPPAASPQATAWNRPPPRQGPKVPYKNESASNPVLRGFTLAVLARIVSSSYQIQRIFWTLNRFEKLKAVDALTDYEPRHDPTVVPVAVAALSPVEPAPVSQLPTPRPRASSTNYYTSSDFHELYKSGRLTPLDVVDALLPLIRRDLTPPGPYSVAFIDSKVDLVRTAARAATERYRAGTPLSVLDGVPVAVKDEVHLTGYKRTLGSKVDFSDKEDRTAWCLTKWEEAGAVIIGKTNMHEVGLDSTNNNPNWGTPLNPHNPGYYTAGSSGGSAFTVASGICPIALGVDGGGSIRMPSSFCGIYGLKPSHGRVSTRVGHEWVDSVVVTGPMASSVDDLALAYRIMAQPDPLARRSAFFPSPLVTAPPPVPRGPKYIGVVRDWVNRSDPDVLSCFNAAVALFEKVHGYEIVDIDIPLLPEGQKAHALTILSESRSQIRPDQIAKLTWPNQLILNVAGSHASAQDFIFAQKLRNLLMSHLAWLWQEQPNMLILTPTMPCAGWKIGRPSDITDAYGISDLDMTLRTLEFTYLANFTGNPAISCPMGYTDDHLPMGLMAMGDWGSEEQLLAFGKESESLLGADGGIRRPQGDKAWIDVLAPR